MINPSLAALCGLFLAASLPAADVPASSIHPEADRLLRAASDALTRTKAFSYKAEVWQDELVDGHKVATTRTVETLVRRPDRVQMEVRSPKRSRGFWYDGQTLTLLDRRNNLYGAIAVPGTIEALLDVAEDEYGIRLPLEDLLLNDPYASAMAGIKGGAYFGKVTVLGTPCEHIAFSTDRVDWQLWIEDGPNPLPRKLVITYKQEPTQPQYTAIFSSWKLRSSLSDKTFTFVAPKGASQIEMLSALPTE